MPKKYYNEVIVYRRRKTVFVEDWNEFGFIMDTASADFDAKYPADKVARKLRAAVREMDCDFERTKNLLLQLSAETKLAEGGVSNA